MARGDVFRLALSGRGVAQDSSWVPGALATEFPVDVVSVTKPVGATMQATVRARSDAALTLEGKVLRASGAFSAPGVDMPEATITQVELVGRDESGASSSAAWLTDEMKWVGSLALIAVTALLSSRIKKQP